MTPTTPQPVLVTGATGFIGAHLVRRLVAGGCRVSCLVRATSRVNELRAAGAELVTCDVTDREGVSRVITSSKARVVYHLAGLVRAVRPGDFMRVNEGGVAMVAAACAERADPPVLVLVSSLAAAGPSGDTPKAESDPPSPVSEYGRSKLAGEQAAAKYAGVVPTTVVRPCVVFGPGDRGVYEMFRPIDRFGIHIVPRRGDGRVSLIAVADLVECIVLAAEQGERCAPGGSAGGGRGRGIYFAAAEDVSYVELGGLISHAIGKPQPRIFHLPGGVLRAIGCCGDIVSRLGRRPGWVGRDKISEVLAGSWTCSTEKARRQLGLVPAAALAVRFRETAEWYREAGWL